VRPRCAYTALSKLRNSLISSIIRYALSVSFYGQRVFNEFLDLVVRKHPTFVMIHMASTKLSTFAKTYASANPFPFTIPYSHQDRSQQTVSYSHTTQPNPPQTETSHLSQACPNPTLYTTVNLILLNLPASDPLSPRVPSYTPTPPSYLALESTQT
jgi:hypothetical protein